MRADGGITSDTFAGDAGPITVVADRLEIEGGFISSATFRLSAQQLQREPLAGGVFAVPMDAPGLPATPFGQ